MKNNILVLVVVIIGLTLGKSVCAQTPLAIKADFGNENLTLKKLIPFLEPRVANDNYKIQLGSTTGAGLEVIVNAYNVNREEIPLQKNILINEGIETVQRQTNRGYYGNIGTAILGRVIGGIAESQKRPEKFEVVYYKVDVTAKLWDQTRYTGVDIETDAIIYQLQVYYDYYGQVTGLEVIRAVDAVTGEEIPGEMPEQGHLTKAFADFSLKLFAAKIVLTKTFPL